MKTHPDPGINEVRRARMALSARFDHDLQKLCAYLRQEQGKHPGRVIGADVFQGGRKTSRRKDRRKAA